MRTPMLAQLLAKLFLSAEDREFIVGDLEELRALREGSKQRLFARPRYYWDLLSSILARRFGNDPRWSQKRRHHTTRRPTSGQLRTEFHQAIRTLRRDPGSLAVAAVILGLGVGSACVVFGIANQWLLRPVPGVSNLKDVAVLEFSSPEQSNVGLSGPDMEDLRRSANLLDGFSSFDFISVVASMQGSGPVEARGYTVFGDYFGILGVRPEVGRLLRPDECGPDGDPSLVVISERLWALLFDRAPDVVGRQFQADDNRLTVIGVAGDGFRGTDRFWQVDFWVPRSAFVTLAGFPADRLWSRQSRLNQDFIVQVRSGESLEAAQEQVNGLLQGMAERESESGSYLRKLRGILHPGVNPPLMRVLLRATLWVLGAAVILLVVISCANVANLLLIRSVHRRGEVAVRRTLGASAWSIIREKVMESLLLAALGTGIGVGIAWLLGLSLRSESLWGMRFEGVTLDSRTIVFASVAVLLTALLSGTLPAIVSARFDLADGLRDANKLVTSRFGAFRYGLSGLQISLSLILLTGTVLLGRTMLNLHAVDPGLDLSNVSVSNLRLGMLRPDETMEDELQRQILAAAAGVPGVEAAALDYYGPFDLQTRGRIEVASEGENEPDRAMMRWASPGWFELFGVTPLHGRTFRNEDWTPSVPRKTILSAPLARRLFGRTDVVGRRVRLGLRNLEEAEVVGVVGDLRLGDVRLPPDEVFFLPYPIAGLRGTTTVLVRNASSDPKILGAVRDALQGVVPTLPVPQPELLSNRVDAQLAEQTIIARLLGFLSAFALLLAGAGLYAVLAFAVARRKREFGVRLALGADNRVIWNLVARSAGKLVLGGIPIGLGGAYLLSRVLESRLFGVGVLDPASYLGAVCLLGVVSFFAFWFPAAAAVRADPMAVLRQE